MDAVRIGFGIFLPWLTGVAWLRYRWRDGPEGALALWLGYGYVLGFVLMTLLLRGFDAVGLPLTFSATALTLAGLAGLSLFVTRDVPWRYWGEESGLRRERSLDKAVLAVLILLLFVRYAGLGFELAVRPSFAWDAWASWAPKARVWYELRALVPFVDWSAWLQQGPGGAYTIAAHHYPITVPLIQVWMSLALGRWDDSLMNLPWLFCAIALGLGFYGQSRVWGVRPLPSLIAVYFLLSIPLLNTQVALAGSADLWLATVYGLAAMAFLQWCRTREPRQALLALALAATCALIKVPGLIWMLTFVPAVVAAACCIPKKPLLAGGLVAGASVIALVVSGAYVSLPYLGRYQLGFYPDVFGVFTDVFFSVATWHLFWYLWFAIFVATMPALVVSQPVFRAMAVLVATALAFVGGVYVFTPLAEFAIDYTQINRTCLHMVPMLAFVALVSADARAGADD